MTKSKRKLLSRRYRFSYIKYNNNQLIGYEQQPNDWKDTFFNGIKLYYYCYKRKMTPYSSIYIWKNAYYNDLEFGCRDKTGDRLYKRRTRQKNKQLTRKELEEYYDER